MIGPDRVVQSAASSSCPGGSAAAPCFDRPQPKAEPWDSEALRLQAQKLAAAGLMVDAEWLLRRAVALVPVSVPAYVDLTALLSRLGRTEEALALLDDVLARRPESVWALSLKAAVLETERRVDQALAVHQVLVARASAAAVPWLNYGHTLAATGRLDEAVAAYRRSLELDPANGYAWWGLANLRTIRFSAEDVARMERALPRVGDDLNRVQLHFALGKALSDFGAFEPSFRHYEQANRIRGRIVPYDADGAAGRVARARETFTSEFLARHAGSGCDAPDPIFIVGLPRAGSTLVEQILSSHPLVEGIGELRALTETATRLGGSGDADPGWIHAVRGLDAGALAALGASYLAGARRYRRTERPFFTDKMPANWQHLGLIRLILPNARIIDVRRDPLACCFSAFTTYFNRETRFPTDLADLGRYYRSYVDLTDHFDAVAPGCVHRVRYERLVDDLEGEVRRLLDYLGLPFDEACLRFHETARAIHTPSAQQVREPINRQGLERWRSYEPWLEPLKCALGSSSILHPGPGRELRPGEDVSCSRGVS